MMAMAFYGGQLSCHMPQSQSQTSTVTHSHSRQQQNCASFRLLFMPVTEWRAAQLVAQGAPCILVKISHVNLVSDSDSAELPAIEAQRGPNLREHRTEAAAAARVPAALCALRRLRPL